MLHVVLFMEVGKLGEACLGDDEEPRSKHVKFEMPIRQPSGDAKKAAGCGSHVFWEKCGLGCALVNHHQILSPGQSILQVRLR